MRVHTLTRKQASLIVGMLSVLACACSKPNDPVTGGGCRYARYPGSITVKTIERDEQVAETSNPARQSVVVTVEFVADSNSGPTQAARINDTVSITPREAEAKDVKAGKQYRAYSMYLSNGTCNPGPYLAPFSEWNP